MRTNRQLVTGQASGDGPVLARIELSQGTPKEEMGACEIILLPWERKEIAVGVEHSGVLPRRWTDMVGGPESGRM